MILPGTPTTVEFCGTSLITTALAESLDSFFAGDVLAAEELKHRIDNQLKNIHKEIQEDISKHDKEVVSKLTSLISFLGQLREVAIDIGDLVIANDTSLNGHYLKD